MEESSPRIFGFSRHRFGVGTDFVHWRLIKWRISFKGVRIEPSRQERGSPYQTKFSLARSLPAGRQCPPWRYLRLHRKRVGLAEWRHRPGKTTRRHETQ